MERAVTFTFTSHADAEIFALWWRNGGREKLEDDIAAIRVELPAFNANHTIEHAGQSEAIAYE